MVRYMVRSSWCMYKNALPIPPATQMRWGWNICMKPSRIWRYLGCVHCARGGIHCMRLCSTVLQTMNNLYSVETLKYAIVRRVAISSRYGPTASVPSLLYCMCAISSVITTSVISLSVYLFNKMWNLCWFWISILQLLNYLWFVFTASLLADGLVCIQHVFIPQKHRCSSVEIPIRSSCWCSSLCWWGTWCSAWLCRSYAAVASKKGERERERQFVDIKNTSSRLRSKTGK